MGHCGMGWPLLEDFLQYMEDDSEWRELLLLEGCYQKIDEWFDWGEPLIFDGSCGMGWPLLNDLNE